MLKYKKIISSSILTVHLIAISFFYSCDDIKDGQYLIPIELPGAKKKVLIEDYTGMKCPNCPNAASTIDSLKKIYGENIVAVSIHAGVYAKPSGIFTQDFRTEEGTIYNSEYNIDTYPTGIVDRKIFNNKVKLDYAEWSSAAMLQVAQESPLGITITNNWTSNSRKLKISIDISIFKAINEDLKLQVWLVEDSIVAPQVNKSQVINNYTHRHVLRGALNGVWGEDLQGAIKDVILNKTLEYNLPEKYDVKHCSIVGFVYKASDKSVIQINERKIQE